MRRYHVTATWDAAGGREGDTITEPLNTRAEAFVRAEERLGQCERARRAGIEVAIYDNLAGETVGRCWA